MEDVCTREEGGLSLSLQTSELFVEEKKHVRLAEGEGRGETRNTTDTRYFFGQINRTWRDCGCVT